MKTRNKVQAWTGIFFLLFATNILQPLTAQTINTKKLDELMTHLEERNEMGSLSISKNGNILYSRAIGYRFVSDETRLPANSNSKYRIWSVTKTYTATMILQLIEEGKLALRTTLNNFFPRIANASEITIEQMLMHRSGIHDFTQPQENVGAALGEEEVQMVDHLSAFTPDFAPGEKFQYSNSNYLLLGYIVERLDKTSYGDALDKRICSKVGLTNTYYGKATLDTVNNKSFSYSYVNNKWTQVAEGEFSGAVPAGAGSIVSTAEDMVMFIHALFHNKLISKESLSKMTAIQEFYGFGIFKTSNRGHSGYGHTGGYIASQSALMYYPQDTLAVAYCTNGHIRDVNDIVQRVLSICFDADYVLPHTRKEVTLTEKKLRKYIGRYQAPQFILNVGYHDGQLHAWPEGRDKSPLFASPTKHLFFLKDMDIQLLFVPGKGKIEKLFILQDGGKMEARKVE